MDRLEAVQRIEEIADEITDLVHEAKDIAEGQGLSIGNLNAYVFEQIMEHVDNANRHNQSLRTIAEEIENRPDIEEGNSVHDKLDDSVSGVVVDMDEDTITIELDGEDAIEVELPRGRVIFDEVGVA